MAKWLRFGAGDAAQRKHAWLHCVSPREIGVEIPGYASNRDSAAKQHEQQLGGKDESEHLSIQGPGRKVFS